MLFPRNKKRPCRATLDAMLLKKVVCLRNKKTPGQRYTWTQCLYSYMYPYYAYCIHIVQQMFRNVENVGNLTKLTFWYFVCSFWVFPWPKIEFLTWSIVLDRSRSPTLMRTCQTISKMYTTCQNFAKIFVNIYLIGHPKLGSLLVPVGLRPPNRPKSVPSK